MNRAELEAAVTNRTKVAPKVVAQVVSALFDAIADSLSRGEKVSQSGFGSFEVVATPKKRGRGVLMDDAGHPVCHRSVAFKAGKHLETAMNDREPA